MADSTAPVTPSLPPCVSYSISSISHVICISDYSPVSLLSSSLPSDLTLPLPCSHHYHQTPHIWQILLNLPIPQPTTLRQLVSIIHISGNMYVRLLSHIPPTIPTTISPHSTSHILPVPTQTAPYMTAPTNHCNPQPTTPCQLVSIIVISCNIYVRLAVSYTHLRAHET